MSYFHRSMTPEDLIEPSEEFRQAVAECLRYPLRRVVAAVTVTPTVDARGAPSMSLQFMVEIDGREPNNKERQSISEMLNTSEFVKPS